MVDIEDLDNSITGVLDIICKEKNVSIICTCSACPEQYDVVIESVDNILVSRYTYIGYLRLRHGEFSAQYPDVNGEVVYFNDNVSGDGCFDNNQERYKELSIAIEKILDKHYPGRIRMVI